VGQWTRCLDTIFFDFLFDTLLPAISLPDNHRPESFGGLLALHLALQGSDLIEPFLTRYGTFHMPFWDAVHRRVLRPDAVRAALQGLKLGSATATSRVAQWGGSFTTSWLIIYLRH